MAEDEGMRSASWWMGIVVMAAACQRPPAPVLEYGETVTYTSTANDSAPQPLPAAHAAGSVPEQPPAAAPAPQPAASAPPPIEPDAVPTSDAEWTTTVHTGDVRGVSSSSEPAEPAPAPVDDAPPPPAAERPAPRQWYKAKPW